MSVGASLLWRRSRPPLSPSPLLRPLPNLTNAASSFFLLLLLLLLLLLPILLCMLLQILSLVFHGHQTFLSNAQIFIIFASLILTSHKTPLDSDLGWFPFQMAVTSESQQLLTSTHMAQCTQLCFQAWCSSVTSCDSVLRSVFCVLCYDSVEC